MAKTDLFNSLAKNILINPGFDVWQRGTQFDRSGGGAYSADRWLAYNGGGGIMRVESKPAKTFPLVVHQSIV